MNIAVVSRSYDHGIGGMEVHTKQVVEYLAKSGHHVTVLTPQLRHGVKPTFKMDNVNVVRVSPMPNDLTKYDMKFWNRVAEHVKADVYDRVVNISMGIGNPFTRWNNALKSKTVTILHGTYVLERKTSLKLLRTKPTSIKYILAIPYTFIFDAILRRVCSRSVRIISVSKAVTQSLTNDYGIKNVLTIENFVDADVFNGQVRSNHAKRILFSSRLHQEKGVFVFLELAKKLNERLSEKDVKVEYHVVGDGPAKEELRQRINDESIGNMLLHGSLSQAEVARVMSESDIFIFPTLRSEGLPLSMLEAMSSGLPVYASRVSGVIEVISDGSNGYLFEPGDVNMLTELVEHAVLEGISAEVSKGARDTVLDKYNARKQLKAIEAAITG